MFPFVLKKICSCNILHTFVKGWKNNLLFQRVQSVKEGHRYIEDDTYTKKGLSTIVCYNTV